MSTKISLPKLVLGFFIMAMLLPLASQKKQMPDPSESPNTIVIRDTVYIEKIVRDTIVKTKISYIDTTPLVLNQRRSFVYIKDTFNIDERTFYVTEEDDTVKTFYFDYTYYIFKYHFKDSLVAIDSILGCDLYTHCICGDKKRTVIFHTCEGESRMIINMLNEEE